MLSTTLQYGVRSTYARNTEYKVHTQLLPLQPCTRQLTQSCCSTCQSRRYVTRPNLADNDPLRPQRAAAIVEEDHQISNDSQASHIATGFPGRKLSRCRAHRSEWLCKICRPYRHPRNAANVLFSQPHTTYYDRRHRQGPALIRARRPYLFKNAITGLGLGAVVGAICAYHSRY